MSERPLLCVVDDDVSVRESLPDLLSQLGLDVHAFSSAEDFLASQDVDMAACLILDVAMPGMKGPDLQRELALRGNRLPIVFITAHAHASVRQQMLARGAVACIFKPFSERDLLAAVRTALDRP